MAKISSVDARRLFTKTLIDVYREETIPTNFLRSFFPNRETSNKNVSIEVERGTEKLAVDVRRGTEGNRNEIVDFTEKIITPAYYREYFDATDLYFYDQLFGMGDLEMDAMTFNEWIQEVASKLRLLQNKIERSIEKQCADVLELGTVTLENATNINFRRKANSLVDLGAGNYFDDAGVNPITSIEQGCLFLRTEGKMMGGVVNMIAGGEVLNRLLENESFQDRANLRRVDLVNLGLPQRIADSVGAAVHGQFSAGSFTVNLWTYPQFYDAAGSGASTPYINDKKLILLPMNPRFHTAFGAVPKIIRDVRNAEFPEFIRQQRGAFTVGNYIEERTEEHIFDIKSAPIAIPVAVDQIYTAQAVAP